MAGHDISPAPNGEELPDPDPRQVRMLKAVVIGLAVLIVLALAALVAGIVVKGGRLVGSDRKGGWVTPLMAQVPPDAEVESMALDGDRLVVHVKRPDGSGELLVFDLRRKNLSGRIRLEPGSR